MGVDVAAHQTPCIFPRAVLVNEGPRVCWGLGGLHPIIAVAQLAH